MYRVTQQTMYSTFTAQINASLVDYMNLTYQSATQKAVNSPSDDPAAAASILNYRASIAQTEQYESNVDTALGWLELTDGVLSQVSTTLTRLKELAEQAATGTMTDENRLIIAAEANELFEQLIELSNSEFNDRFIFSGQSIDQIAYELGIGVTATDSEFDGVHFTATGSIDTSIMVRFEVPDSVTANAPEVEYEIEYQVDEDGDYVLDDNGDKIPAYQTYEAGDLILDENGDPTIIGYNTYGENVYALDDDGMYILEDDGTYTPVRDASGTLLTGYESLDVDNTDFYTLEHAASDENLDDPIYDTYVGDGTEYVLDEDGKIPVYTDEYTDAYNTAYAEYLATYEAYVANLTLPPTVNDPVYVQDTEADGLTPLVDADGNPVYVQAKDDNGNLLYETDADGNQILDADGDPIPVYVQAEDENGNLLYNESYPVQYSYSSDGGTTWTTGTIDYTSTQIDLGTASVTIPTMNSVQLNPYDPSLPYTESNGSSFVVRPAAIYTGYDGNVPPDIDIYGELNGNVDYETNGIFEQNIQVRIDEDIDLSNLSSGDIISYSYSTDNGQTWVEETVAATIDENGEAYARLPIPGGFFDLSADDATSTAIAEAGIQFSISPQVTSINYESAQSSYITVNNVGIDVFGGLYTPQGTNIEVSAFDGDSQNLFETIGSFIGALETNDQDAIGQALDNIEDAQSYLLLMQAEVGGKISRLDQTSIMLESSNISETERLSAIEDVDIIELINALTLQQTAYQTILQATSMITSLSLTNFL